MEPPTPTHLTSSRLWRVAEFLMKIMVLPITYCEGSWKRSSSPASTNPPHVFRWLWLIRLRIAVICSLAGLWCMYEPLASFPCFLWLAASPSFSPPSLTYHWKGYLASSPPSFLRKEGYTCTSFKRNRERSNPSSPCLTHTIAYVATYPLTSKGRFQIWFERQSQIASPKYSPAALNI